MNNRHRRVAKLKKQEEIRNIKNMIHAYKDLQNAMHKALKAVSGFVLDMGKAFRKAVEEHFNE